MLLVLGGAGSTWYASHHQEKQRLLWQYASWDHEGTGWQAAAKDSL